MGRLLSSRAGGDASPLMPAVDAHTFDPSAKVERHKLERHQPSGEPGIYRYTSDILATCSHIDSGVAVDSADGSRK